MTVSEASDVKHAFINWKILAIVSFAVFSAHYGVGDLIFPIFLGRMTGANWVLGALGYALINSGLVFLGYLVVVYRGKSLFSLSEMILGREFAYVYTSIAMLILSVLFILPRVASATYSMAFALFYPQVPLWVFLILYFAINYYIVYSRPKVFDKLGLYIAPALLLFILVVFIAGIIHPLSSPIEPGSPTALADGVLNAYNTMNGLAAALMGLWIMNEFRRRGIKEREEMFKNVVITGGIVAIFLAFTSTIEVYIGATSGAKFPEAAIGELTVNIVRGLLGPAGTAIFAILLALACITTSAGVLSTAGDVFEEMSKGKMKYKWTMIWGNIVGYFIGLAGLQAVINYAVPWLMLIYPAFIVMIAFHLVKKFESVKLAAQAGVITAIFFSIGDWLQALGVGANPFTTMNLKMPGGNVGLAWLLPTIVVAAVVQVASILIKRAGSGNK